jgi:chromate reductase
MSAVKLLVFSGSTRQGSHNTKLATAVAAMAGDLGAKVTLISLADFEAPLFNQDWERENGVPQTITDLGALMAESDAAFIASPEYNSGVTPLLKNTIDWLSRLKPHPIKETVFSLGGASPGMLGAFAAFFRCAQRWLASTPSSCPSNLPLVAPPRPSTRMVVSPMSAR